MKQVREYAENAEIPFRKALLWAKPYDTQERKKFLKTLPEYAVVDIEAGGLIAIEEK